jgi:hypothetical protein
VRKCIVEVDPPVLSQSQKQDPTDQETKKGAVVVPYIRGTSEIIHRSGKNNSEYEQH